jgi:hypothetical protein
MSSLQVDDMLLVTEDYLQETSQAEAENDDLSIASIASIASLEPEENKEVSGFDYLNVWLSSTVRP